KTPNIQLTAISTVAGNATVEQTTENVLKILSLLDEEKDVEPAIGMGAPKPLKRAFKTAERYHGHDGLGNTGDLFEGAIFEKFRDRIQPAVDLIVDTLLHSKSL
ncbi:MAG: hypothetical protein GTN39_03675, partial [Candidatus Aenigmarchaeota archaeon]|nr:hypothetical protein [Candidatus Aenigmarchaeota archaeon]